MEFHILGKSAICRRMGDVIEGIRPRARGVSLAVFKAVDAYADDSLSLRPRSLDLIVNPLPIRRTCADEHDGTTSPKYLTVDPPLDGKIPALLNRLPVIVRNRAVVFEGVHISDLGHPPAVCEIVKAKENLSSH